MFRNCPSLHAHAPSDVRWIRARFRPPRFTRPPTTSLVYTWLMHRRRLMQYSNDIRRRPLQEVRVDVRERGPGRAPRADAERRAQLPKSLEAERIHQVHDSRLTLPVTKAEHYSDTLVLLQVFEFDQWTEEAHGFVQVFGAPPAPGDLSRVFGADPGSRYSVVATNCHVTAKRLSSEDRKSLYGQQVNAP